MSRHGTPALAARPKFLLRIQRICSACPCSCPKHGHAAWKQFQSGHGMKLLILAWRRQNGSAGNLQLQRSDSYDSCLEKATTFGAGSARARSRSSCSPERNAPKRVKDVQCRCASFVQPLGQAARHEHLHSSALGMNSSAIAHSAEADERAVPLRGLAYPSCAKSSEALQGLQLQG